MSTNWLKSRPSTSGCSLGILITLILISLYVFVVWHDTQNEVLSESQKIATDNSIRYLNLPERIESSVGGSEFANQVSDLSIIDREKAIINEILSGNVPSFSRKLMPIKLVETINGKSYELIFYTTYDYLAIGSDLDYLYIPMTPSTGQYLTNSLACSLPTSKIVDIVYTNTRIKLAPQPIPPSDSMVTIPVFRQHSDSIKQQLLQIGLDRSSDIIIAGHKKDIVLSNKIYSSDKSSFSVVIYGWHLDEDSPIQPLYNGHSAMYVDYSHGVRLISNLVFINGNSVQLDNILKDPKLSILLSNEGAIDIPYYPIF